MKNEQLLPVIQVLLLLNLFGGFIGSTEGSLFGNMYSTNALMNLEKSILNLGVYLISLLFSSWFLKQDHLPEFFILLLSALLGMDLLISSGNLLMFYLS
jgi:NADH-quinone oxidoreductase subunit N